MAMRLWISALLDLLVAARGLHVEWKGAGPSFDEVLIRAAHEQMDAAKGRYTESSDALHLVTSIFLPEGHAHGHIKEIVAAFATNVENPHIASLHVLLESPSEGCSDLLKRMANATGTPVRLIHKVVCTMVKKQPTYRDFFQYANERMRHHQVILTNADIVFDSTLALIAPLTAGVGHVLSVKPPPYKDEFKDIFLQECKQSALRCKSETSSWDAFIFLSPLPGKLEDFELDYPMNIIQAENFAAGNLRQMGLNITNPCMHVNAFHWHCFSGKMHKEWPGDKKPKCNYLAKTHPCEDFPDDASICQHSKA